MSKKSKVKCPRCKSKDIESDHHDCPTCDCGELYVCNQCHLHFDTSGEEL